MNEAQIYEDLTLIIRDVLMHEDVHLSPGLTAKEVQGWDSFKMIEIVMAVESHFAIKVPSKKLDSLEKVGDLVDLIKSARSVDA